MARRNPANPRYQKGGDVGKTRRSAASAKPKRAAGDASADSSKKSKKKRGGFFKSFPMTPEYRRWRKMWAGMLGAAIVFSALAWWQQGTGPGAVALAFAYACIFTALYIDFFRLRRLRKAAIEEDKAGKSGSKKADKDVEADKGDKGDKDA